MLGADLPPNHLDNEDPDIQTPEWTDISAKSCQLILPLGKG
jgi:hypothetical protein